MTKEEIIENSIPKVKELDSNNAIIYDQFVMLTHETYDEIKKKLEILDILKEYCKEGVDKYGVGTWGWVEFTLDYHKEDAECFGKKYVEDKKKLQEWLKK